MNIFKRKLSSEFLIRVIKNDITPNEKVIFYKWINESAENKKEFEAMLLLWGKFELSKLPGIPDSKDLFNAVQARIKQESQKDSMENISFDRIKPSGTRLFEQRYHHSIAWQLRFAIILVVCVSAYLFLTRETTKDDIAPKKIVEEVIYYEVSTPKGARRTIQLADGSTVSLNSESKLTYPKYFADNTREVELIGEAYFDIHPDNTKPFRVITGETIIEVTGTEFNVRYRNEKLSLVVSEGSVRSYKNDPGSAVGVKRGEMITYNRRDGFSKIIKANLPVQLAWKSNKFGFDHTPLSEVMDELSRHYNVDVVFTKKELENRMISGLFESANLDKVLSIISFSMDLQIERRERTIIVK